MTATTSTVDLVTISAVDPPGPTVVCRHGDGISKYSSASGWQLTKRPKRVSMTEFMGPDPYTMVIPIVFGGNATDQTLNVEPTIEVLRGIARNPVGPRNQPAVVQITAELVSLTWLRWIIADLEIVSEMRTVTGLCYWASANLTLYQWEPTDLTLAASGRSIAQQTVAVATGPGGSGGAGANPQTSTWSYTVKAGDNTLIAIAAAQLNDGSLWQSIANLNGITDPASIKVGQVLRMPGNPPVSAPVYGTVPGDHGGTVRPV